MNLNIGENIKKLRSTKQVTQEQLADHLSISYQAVSKWENNVTTPDIYLLPAIAEYFGVLIDELFKVELKGYKNKAARLNAMYQHSQTKENFDKADAEYEKLIAEGLADNEDFHSYGILNQFHAQVLNKKAEEYLIKAGDRARCQLLILLASQGRYKENIERYENAPETAKNIYLLAYSYCDVNLEKALEISLKGLEKFPNDASLLGMCGDICRSLDRREEAIEYHKKSVEQNPDAGDSYYSMAFIYAEMKMYKEAILAWEEVIALHGRLGITEEEIEFGTEWPKREIAKLKTFLDE